MTRSDQEDAYDYVVVGGGTAGSVIAARLSEDPTISVLLLEAGPQEPGIDISHPVAWPRLARTIVDWGDTTVPQTAAADGQIVWPRGRVLGGSSAINGMMHVRGDRSTFDEWAAIAGEGWTFSSLLPFFKRSESALGRDSFLRGNDGPMTVSVVSEREELWEACIAASVEAGHPHIEDGNDETAIGVSWNETTVVDNKRLTVAEAYLTPARARPNLQVVADALATRLLIEDNECRGVEYRLEGRTLRATARHEVVLTCGAIGTPQLLLLSGIGPADHLAEVGIPVLVDLPGVGSNLQDHPMSYVSYRASGPVAAGHARKPHVLAQISPGGTGLMQVIFVGKPMGPRWTPLPGDGYSLAFSLMNPASRGTVRLASADPTALPLIDPAFLSDPSDVDQLLVALNMAREIGETEAFASFRNEEVVPGAQSSIESLREYLRKSITTYFHPVGTARIGSDPMAVVTSRLSVRNITGLKIADASVMPTLPSGNTNATVLAIAERASELFVEDRSRT